MAPLPPVALAEVRKRSRRSKSLPEMQKSHFSVQDFRNFPNASERFRTHPDASECIRTGPNRSEQVRIGPNTSENFEKRANTSKNSRKVLKKNHERLFFSNLFQEPITTLLKSVYEALLLKGKAFGRTRCGCDGLLALL